MSALYDPRFWQTFVSKMVPLDEEMEERMLTSLATREKLSTAFVRQRMVAFLRGRVAESRGEVHPGTDATN